MLFCQKNQEMFDVCSCYFLNGFFIYFFLNQGLSSNSIEQNNNNNNNKLSFADRSREIIKMKINKRLF